MSSTMTSINVGEAAEVDAQEMNNAAISETEGCTSEEEVTKSFQCQECHWTFNSAASLQKHAKTHLKPKPFKCTFCPKQFVSKSGLDNHLMRHTGERPYECHDCAKTFASRSVLVMHMRSHTGEKPYQCLVCGDRFTQSASLADHRRIHTGEMPYTCEICHKKFKHKAVYRIHMAAHKNAKGEMKECNVCHKKYTAFKLKTHIRVHKKPFKCAECGDHFSNKYMLETHIFSKHIKQELHACNICGKTFFRTQCLKQHIATHDSNRGSRCHRCGLWVLSSKRKHTKHCWKLKPKNFLSHLCKHCGKQFTIRVTYHHYNNCPEKGVIPSFFCDFCKKECGTIEEHVTHLLSYVDRQNPLYKCIEERIKHCISEGKNPALEIRDALQQTGHYKQHDRCQRLPVDEHNNQSQSHHSKTLHQKQCKLREQQESSKAFSMSTETSDTTDTAMIDGEDNSVPTSKDINNASLFPTSTNTTNEPSLILISTNTTNEPSLIPTSTNTTNEPSLILISTNTTNEPSLIPTSTNTTNEPSLIPTSTNTTNEPSLIPTSTNTTNDASLIPNSYSITKDKNLLKVHIHSENSTKQSYKCKICGKTFLGTKCFKKHIVTHDSNRGSRCHRCGLWVLSLMSRHTKHCWKLNPKNFLSHLCKHCGKQFTIRVTYHHYDNCPEKGVIPSFFCDFCKKECGTIEEHMTHLFSYVDRQNRLYKCIEERVEHCISAGKNPALEIRNALQQTGYYKQHNRCKWLLEKDHHNNKSKRHRAQNLHHNKKQCKQVEEQQPNLSHAMTWNTETSESERTNSGRRDEVNNVTNEASLVSTSNRMTNEPSLVSTSNRMTNEPSLVSTSNRITNEPSLVSTSNRMTNEPSLVSTSNRITNEPSLVSTSNRMTNEPSLVSTSNRITNEPSLVSTSNRMTNEPSLVSTSNRITNEPSLVSTSNRMTNEPSLVPTSINENREPSIIPISNKENHEMTSVSLFHIKASSSKIRDRKRVTTLNNMNGDLSSAFTSTSVKIEPDLIPSPITSIDANMDENVIPITTTVTNKSSSVPSTSTTFNLNNSYSSGYAKRSSVSPSSSLIQYGADNFYAYPLRKNTEHLKHKSIQNAGNRHKDFSVKSELDCGKAWSSSNSPDVELRSHKHIFSVSGQQNGIVERSSGKSIIQAGVMQRQYPLIDENEEVEVKEEVNCEERSGPDHCDAIGEEHHIQSLLTLDGATNFKVEHQGFY